MDVLIVGAGAMGRWFGDRLEGTVTFTDIDLEAARSAADSISGRAVPLESDERYDVVCLAVPMSHVTEAIETHASRATRALLDVSGVMGEPLEAMAAAAPALERVSLHPLFAPERAPGRIAVVRDRSGPVTDDVLATLEAAGNDLIETTVEEHDEAMQTVQAATHAAVLAFALATEPVSERFGTPIYDELESLARTVTGGTPRVYADIQTQFDGAEWVAETATTLSKADHAELEALYRDASERWHDCDVSDAESARENADVNATSEEDAQ